MVNIPQQIFKVFPTEPENRMRLLLNILRHESIQVILGLYMEQSENPRKLQAKIRQEHGVTIDGIEALFDETLVPSHQAKRDLTGEYLMYQPTHWSKNYGRPVAQFTMRYGIDHELPLGEIFGREKQRGQPATFRRYKMLKGLYQAIGREKGFNIASLSRDTMTNSSTVMHDLEVLADRGVININILDVDKVVPLSYKWKGSQSTRVDPSSPIHVHNVARYMQRKRRGIKFRDIVQQTGHPSYKVGIAIDALRTQSLIGNEGVIHIEHEWDVRMSVKGKGLWETYFAQLYAFVSGKQKLPGFADQVEAARYATQALQVYAKKA